MSDVGVLGAFVSADWSKDAGKRSVHVAMPRTRCIRRAKSTAWSLAALLQLARELKEETGGPVLLGMDLALGVPVGYWRMVQQEAAGGRPPRHFLDWLAGLDPESDFFREVRSPDDWRTGRPFFAVQPGEGGKTAFTRKVAGNMLRRIDEATGAKPLFAVSGMPGTVGSATRALWRELIPLLKESNRDFAVWPFEGALPALLADKRIVLAESYPGLAYAAALAARLPTRRRRIAKTQKAARVDFCDHLAKAAWVREHGVCLGDLGPARADDDAFDSHVTAAAVLRCLLEGWALCDDAWVDGEAEGAMLLAGPVDPEGDVDSRPIERRRTIMSIEEILAYLNAAHIRCTYKAVGEATGVPPNP